MSKTFGFIHYLIYYLIYILTVLWLELYLTFMCGLQPLLTLSYKLINYSEPL